MVEARHVSKACSVKQCTRLGVLTRNLRGNATKSESCRLI
jgi:hypothetical protein